MGQAIRVAILLTFVVTLAGCVNGAGPVTRFFDAKAERETEQNVNVCKCGYVRGDSAPAGGWARAIKTRGKMTFRECAALCFPGLTIPSQPPDPSPPPE